MDHPDGMEERLKKVRLLLLDVDGVLTDETIIYTDNGTEVKVFNVKDGLGLKLLMKAGIKVGIVTGRGSNALTCRLRDLGITLVYDRISDKGKVLEAIVNETGIPPQEIAFAGDDLPDIPLLRKVGLPIAVQNAHGHVIEVCLMVTEKKGGQGAVREICEALLKAQARWERSIHDVIQ